MSETRKCRECGKGGCYRCVPPDTATPPTPERAAVREALVRVFDAANISARPLTLNDLAAALGLKDYSHSGLADALLRPAPLPADVQAAVERVKRNLCGDGSDLECTFGDHLVETRDLRTLLAHLTREAR